MSTVAATHRAPAGKLSSGGILRSEWIKLRSLRSTVWSYAIVIMVSLGMAALMSASAQSAPDGTFFADDATMIAQASTFGIVFGQLVVAVLGVLVMSGEYTTGMVRSTLTAVPRRLAALWAKATVLFAATLAVGLVSSVGAFLVASSIFADKGVSANLFDDGIYIAIIGGALYLALVSVFSLGLGAILRSSAGGVAAALGVILLLPVVLQLIPATWALDALPYTISSAGMNMFSMTSFSSVPIDNVKDLLITLGWVAVSLAGAAVLLKRRDA
jgi:ABC-2 type transport system permease protein